MVRRTLTILLFICTTRMIGLSAECPGDGPAVSCVAAPCNVTVCPCFTDTVCRNDYCGGCSARFYVGAIEVTDNCQLCVPDKIRLLGGTSNAGIVELYVDAYGMWEKLCTAWRFSDNEAALICRELGFSRGLSLFLAAYGPMGGKYSAPLTGCKTDEKSISNCTYDKNSTLCLHQNTFYASVACYNETSQPVITDRLENDSNDTNYGQVTLYRRNVWGQVCAGYWSDLDADVFCRQMNFKGGYALKYKAKLGVAFVKTAVNCNGTENNIEDCESESQICYDKFRAGALCYRSSGLSLRLQDGGSSSGRVEVTFDGVKGSFCNVGWTDDDGEIICRQLGFETGTKYDGTIPPGTGEVYLSRIQCTQYEDSVLMCDSSGWKNVTDPNCLDHLNDAGVYCYRGVRLAGGISRDYASMGRVEVYQKVHSTGFGYWSTLCAEHFDQTDADVVCRQLQYERAKVLSPGTFGRAIYSMYTTSINCSGSETKLLDCPHETKMRCSDYASVLCTMDGVVNNLKFYLEKPYSGKVIVEQYGVNGTICRNGWGDNDANAVCQSLGYKGGHAFGTLQTYIRYAPIWISDVGCKGTEADLENCPMSFDVPMNCSKDRSSAGAICFESTGLKTRIVSGFTSHTGRLEVSRDGVWGTVCDNSWSAYDSRVACRELGYADGIAYGGSYHGSGTGPIYLDGLQCDGTETSIFSCPHNGWNVSSSLCRDHTKDAGVYCYRWVVLSQTGSLYGSVHVWKPGIGYGHVCSDGFDEKAAQVICKELGYNLAIPLCCSSFGPSELPYVMSNVKCTGNESSIRNCQHESTNPVCSSNTYASVACSPESSVPPDGWIVSSVISYRELGYGYVQVNYFNHLGLVCSEGFDDEDARVTCVENGFVTGYAYKHDTTSQHFSHEIRWLGNITCKGTESRIADCGNLNWGQTDVCSHQSAAGAICVHSQDITEIKARLTNGTSTEGRVELKTGSFWQSVCSDKLTHKEASVLCRSQGFLDGVLLSPGKYGNGTYMRLSGLNCTGDENKVADCILALERYSITCKLGAAAVKCYTNIRLTGSDLVEYGRLEMYNGTGWDAVCDDGFDDRDANVVCRYMGYVAGKSQCCSRLGVLPSTTRIAITKFGCSGGESKPQNCAFVNGSCSTGHYVTVLCISKFTGEDLSVRLPLKSFYGPVEARRFGLWGYICDAGWNDKAARVVCRHLGFVSGHAVMTRIDDRTPIIMGNVSCLGSESNLDHCSFTKFGEDHGCFSRESVAGVICTNAGGIQFNIVWSSLAKITVDNSSLYIDSMNFDKPDASVFCKSAGYAGGSVGLYQSRITVSVSGLNCTGIENSLLKCKAFWDPRKSKKNMPAGVSCHKGVRLTSGKHFYGIVEVYRNNSWGTICNKQFGNTEAGLVCKELDFEHGLSMCCAPFGYITSSHAATTVQCSGTESKFSDCAFKWTRSGTVTTSVCDVPWDYASVVCYSGPLIDSYRISLSSGSTYTGDIVLNFLNVPGRICGDGWDDNDARVACRELNFQSGSAYNHYVEDGPRSHGPYWTSNIGCIGTEQSIGQCSKTQFGKVTICKSKHYAGVVCYNDEGLFYRLMGGDGQYGRVEVNLFDKWGSICDTHWDQREAHVLCGQRGYTTGDPYYGQYNIPGSGPVYETQFECIGNESDLNNCPHGRWETAKAQRCLQHENDAGVFCYKSVKLHNGIGRETSAGAVLFYKYNQWNLICDEGFTHNSAKIVCKDLGFIDGRADCCSSYGQILWELLSNHSIRCTGDEPDVATCAKQEKCNSQSYASVKCYDYALPTIEPSTSTIRSLPPLINPTLNTLTRVDNTSTIVAVVVTLLVVIIIIVIVLLVVLIKWRRTKEEHKHERFHDDILEHADDGSVRVQNPLHEIPEEASDQLTIKSTGAVAYLPNPCENPSAFTNPTYATTEPNRTVINVRKIDAPSSSTDKSPLYDNLTETDAETKERPEITSHDSVRLSLAESAEIHSPDHTMKQPEWPSFSEDTNDNRNTSDKRTEL